MLPPRRKQHLPVKLSIPGLNHILLPYLSPNLSSLMVPPHRLDTTIVYHPQAQPIATSCQICLRTALVSISFSMSLSSPSPPAGSTIS